MACSGSQGTPQPRPVPQKESKPARETPREDEKKSPLKAADVEARWGEFIQRVKHKKITVGSFLQEGVLQGVEGNTIQVAFGLSNGFHVDAIERSKNLILEELRDLFGKDATFCCVKKDLPKRKAVSPEKRKQAGLKELQEKDPVLKKIVDDLDAEIVD